MRIRLVLVISCLAISTALSLALSSRSRTEDIAFFERSSWKPPINCRQHLPPIGGGGLSDLIPITDSTFAALFGAGRELMFFNRNFRPIRSVIFEKEGPRGVQNPISAAISDTFIFVADDGTARIRKFDHSGKDRGTIQLQFLPRRVRLSGNTVMVTPVVAGRAPLQLLFRADQADVRATRVPIASYSDPGINAFANMAALVGFPDRAIVMHEFIVPFGYVLPTGKNIQLRRFAVPLAEEARDDIKRLPTPPITEKNVNEFAVIAFAAAPALHTGSTYYVTRIGNGKQRPYQKVLVELDRNMTLKSVFPIDANPHHMVYVDSPPAIIGADAEDNWFECILR